MKNFRKILVLLIMVMASVISFTACGNPYKDMSLSIDDGGFENSFERSYEYKGEDLSVSISASVIGAKKGVSTDVVFTVHDKNLISLGKTDVEGVKTTQELLIKGTGETYVTINSVEGNLRQDIKIKSFAPATSLSFTADIIPLIREQKTDVSKIMPGLSKALLTFEPSYATEKDVVLTASGTEVSSSNIVVDGNSITVTDAFGGDSFSLNARLKNGQNDSKTVLVKVLEPIKASDIMLGYTSTQEEIDKREGKREEDAIIYKIDKSIENGVDFQLFLADQSAGDVYRDSRNIYMIRQSRDGYSKLPGGTYSFTYKSQNNKNTIITKGFNANSFSISNGAGVDNFDLYYFNINYKDFESYFTGVDICLKVTVSTFPSDVVINTNSDLTNIDKQENIYVFNNYQNMAGTSFYVKICNAGGFISNQDAYVNVWDADMSANAQLGGFTIVDANGERVIPGVTKVKSGAILSIRYDSGVITDINRKFVLYAISAIDSSITSLKYTVDVNGETIYSENNITLVKDYTLSGLQDVTIELNNGSESERLPIDNAGNKLPYELFDVSVGELATLKLVTGKEKDEDNGYFVSSPSGVLGQTYYTVVAPNGQTAMKNAFVTKAVSEATVFELKVGSYRITENGSVGINMDVSKSYEVSLIIDGVEYKTLPPRYAIKLEHSAGSACTTEGWQKIKSLNRPTFESADKFVFTLVYTNRNGDTKTYVFNLNVNVVKPIKIITPSNSRVSILSNEIKPLDSGADEYGYLDISKESSKQISYVLNPSDASIATIKKRDIQLLDLKTGILEFEYGTDSSVVIALLSDMYGEKEDNYSYGSWVEYSTGKYYYDIEIDQWHNGSPTGIVIDAVDTINALHEQYFNFKFYRAETQPGIDDGIDITFKWKATVIDNKIVLDIKDIVSSKNDKSFTIRLAYMQEYITTPKKYFVRKVSNIYEITETSGDDAPALSYISGAFKITQDCFVAVGESLNGVKIAGVYYDMSGTWNGSTGSFDYDRYAIEVDASTIFNVSSPAKTKSITLIGAEREKKLDGNGNPTGDYIENSYEVSLNGNQIGVGDTFGFSYVTTSNIDGKPIEKPGLAVITKIRTADSITQEVLSGTAYYVFNIAYDGKGKVVGVKSGASWQTITGLSFYIDFERQRIDFKIEDIGKFIRYLGADYSKTFSIVGLDTVEDKEPVMVDYKINLRTGTSGNPYEIYDATTLQNVNLALGSDTHYRIKNDISLQGVTTWVPIGKSERQPFEAKIETEGGKTFNIFGFNGTISTIGGGDSYVETYKYIGIFGYIGSRAVIKNLTFKYNYINFKLDNSYVENDLYIGTVAGYIKSGATFSNIKVVDSDSVNYNNYGGLKNISAENFTRGVVFTNVDNANAISIYIGGVAGYMGTSWRDAIVYNTVSVADNYDKHTMYVGGLFGQLDAGTIISGEFGTILRSNNTVKESSLGGIAGWSKGSLSNSTVVTYIYSNGGYNIGGVFGQFLDDYSRYYTGSAKDDTEIGAYINNVDVTPMVFGASRAQYVGGVVGTMDSKYFESATSSKPSNDKKHYIANVKVKFADRGCESSMFNSSVVGFDFVGGIVGRVVYGGPIGIRYSSVFSYVNKPINMGYSESADNSGYYYGDIIANASLSSTETYAKVGGFIGGWDDVTTKDEGQHISNNVIIESVYYNANVRILGGAKFGGVIGYFVGYDYSIMTATLTGNVYYTQNYNYGGNLAVSSIGSFIGAFSTKYKPNINKYYNNKHELITKFDSVDKNQFNIVDSYSLLKAQDLGGADGLDYIKNFVGDGNSTYQITNASGDLDSREVEYLTLDIYRVEVNKFNIKFSTIDGKHKNNEGGVNIEVTPKDGVYEIPLQGISTDETRVICYNSAGTKLGYADGTWKINIPDTTSIDTYTRATSVVVKIKSHITLNAVWALNSFYIGYKTESLYLDSYVKTNYTFNENDLLKSIGEIDADGEFNNNINLSVKNEITGIYSDFSFNYFNGYGYDNFVQPNYTTGILEFGQGVNKTFLGVDNLGWTLESAEVFGSNEPCTTALHSEKSNKTYVYEHVESGVFNTTGETLETFTKYQNWELLDGNAIALKKDKVVNNKPNFVISVAPQDIIVEVTDEYVVNSSNNTIAIVKISDESIRLSNLINVTPIPAMTSDEVVYSLDNENVATISGNDLVLKDEGVVNLTVISALNAQLQAKITVIVVYIDRNNLSWSLKDANSDKDYNEIDANGNTVIDIIAKDGLTLTTVFEGKGTLTYGMEYRVNLGSVNTQDITKKEVFLKSFTIGGKKLNESKIQKVLSGGEIDENDKYDTIECSGLQHAVYCDVLGSIEVTQRLYFLCNVNGVEYKCYISSKDYSGSAKDTKELKFNFKEGVFDISGSEVLSFVVVNKSNFIVALNCDSNIFDIGLTAVLNGNEILINNIILGEEIDLSDYELGQLIIKLDSVQYDDVKKLKVFKFSAYVDDEGQKLVNKDLEYTLQFFAKSDNTVYNDITHSVVINISQQQVENLNVVHYTNMLYVDNTEPTEGIDSYKYSSNIIIPGYTSLLQVDFYPSFGFYDYVEITTSSSLLNINQVVEALNMGGKSVNYSWYELYTERVVRLSNGIRINNKYSTKDYRETVSAMYAYNGSLFISMFADQELADKDVEITITGYKDGVSESLFSTIVNLSVEARPNISINASATEVVFGSVVDLDIQVEYTSESFTASLKSTTSDTELIGSLADVVYNSLTGKYILKVKDTKYTYINYSQFMYQDLVLKVTVSKVINGITVYADKSVNIRLVPFIIDSITVNLDGALQDNRNYVVMYYQAYNMYVSLNTTYSEGYYKYLLSVDPNTSLNVQIANLEAYIAKNVALFSVYSQGVEGNTKKLLTPTSHDYSGEIAVSFNSEYNNTTIRFISASVSDFIWAEIGINYTNQGIELANINLIPEYIFTYNFAVVIDTSSADDHPEPITSVNDLRNMREGVSYILLKDLLLANWSPIDANFNVFDGNGFVITILSFANAVSGGETTNFGIFNTISENSVVKNLTIEVMPFTGIIFTEQDYISSEYSDKVNTQITAGNIEQQIKNGLTVDVSELSNVNFGLLAGTNLGTVTNVNIINSANSLRTEREKVLNSVADSKKININYGDNFTESITALTNKAKDINENVKINIVTKKENETTTKNDNIALLIGSNEGYITNCSVENINLTSQEYVGGLVGYNAKNAKISSSYFRAGNIIHSVPVKEGSGVGGFVSRNDGIIAYSYVYGSSGETTFAGYSKERLNAGTNHISSSGFAGGFVYENRGTITNCYTNIVVVGSAGGFAYKNETEASVIEYCYSLSSVKLNDSISYPFVNKNMASSSTLNKGTVRDCFYLYNTGYVNMQNDAGVALNMDDFYDYNAFVAYAFNADYTENNEVLDAVWYIPNSETNPSFKSSSADAKSAPQLVSANLKTLSVRYLIQDQTEQYAFTYNYATPLGTVTNPILIDSSATFNKSVLTNKSIGETRNYRIIKDVSYNIGDEVSSTNNAIFKGKLDGNGMNLNNLRLTSDGVNTGDSVTKLGLFATITGRRVEGVQQYAVVKNLNINISQIDGINVNVVGVLAGEIINARIYNIVIDGKDIVVQGLNAVGAVAGIVSGDTDLVNLSSSVSVTANYFGNYNPFDYTTSYTQKQLMSKFDNFVKTNTLYDVETNNITNVSYAGGIAGICNIVKRDPTTVSDIRLSSLYNNLYRARRLYLTGTPTISGEVVGGIFGYLAENANMSDCEIKVSKGMHFKSSRLVGGLVGHNLGEIKRSTIENIDQTAIDEAIKKNPKAYDNVKSDVVVGVEDVYGGDDTEYRAMFAGGLIGLMQAGKLLHSYNRITVASKNSLYAGGIVGLSLGGTLLDSVYTTGSVYAYVAYGGVFGYVADKIGGGTFFSKALDTTEHISLNNVVAGNIWKFSHLNTIRKNELSPNMEDAKLGMLVGRVKTADINLDILSREKATNITNRVNYEMVYYKQTYTYKSLIGQTATVPISEIGDDNREDYNNTKKWFVAPKMTGNVIDDGGSYGTRYEYLKSYNSPTEESKKKDKIEELGAYTLKQQYYIDASTGYVSGLYRETNLIGSENADKVYLFSRMGQYGSLRSLSEIIQRRNETKTADEFYKAIGGATNPESTFANNIEKNNYCFEEIQNNISSYYTKSGLKISTINIYENWEKKTWKGVEIKEDGTLIDEDCVFPALKNSIDYWTDVFVYSEKDLRDLDNKNTSNFILMNDIYLSENMGNYCSVDKPFKGTIRSAKIGDIDGLNEVRHNFKFTIFNLKYNAENLANSSSMAVGGLVSASDGASFENFNIHVVYLGIKPDSKISAVTKTSALGVLVGRANNLTTIKNVQILGSSNTVSGTGVLINKNNWADTTGFMRDLGTFEAKTYARSLTQYKNADGKESIFGGQATIQGENFEFMGGYIGVVSNVNTVTADGTTYKLTGEVRIVDDINRPEATALIQGITDKGAAVTNESLNEYISRCQVKNLKFVNKYYGTRRLTDAEVSVVSYIGGYFGLANILDSTDEDHETINFETTNVTIDYDLNVNNEIGDDDIYKDNSIDKYVFDNATIDNGVYLGAVAGKINTIGGIRVNNSITRNTTINVIKSIKNTGLAYVAGGLYVGSYGSLTDEVNFNNLVVDGITINYKNGDSDSNRKGFTTATNFGGASLSGNEYLGGFAGYVGGAVSYNNQINISAEHENEYIAEKYTKYSDYDIAVNDAIINASQYFSESETDKGLFDSASCVYIGGVAGDFNDSLEKCLNIIVASVDISVDVNVASIGGAFGSAVSDKSVQLVDEETGDEYDLVHSIKVLGLEINGKIGEIASAFDLNTSSIGGIIGYVTNMALNECLVESRYGIDLDLYYSSRIGGMYGVVNKFTITNQISLVDIYVDEITTNPKRVYVGGVLACDYSKAYWENTADMVYCYGNIFTNRLTGYSCYVGAFAASIGKGFNNSIYFGAVKTVATNAGLKVNDNRVGSIETGTLYSNYGQAYSVGTSYYNADFMTAYSSSNSISENRAYLLNDPNEEDINDMSSLLRNGTTYGLKYQKWLDTFVAHNTDIVFKVDDEGIIHWQYYITNEGSKITPIASSDLQKLITTDPAKLDKVNSIYLDGDLTLPRLYKQTMYGANSNEARHKSISTGVFTSVNSVMYKVSTMTDESFNSYNSLEIKCVMFADYTNDANSLFIDGIILNRCINNGAIYYSEIKITNNNMDTKDYGVIDSDQLRTSVFYGCEIIIDNAMQNIDNIEKHRDTYKIQNGVDIPLLDILSGGYFIFKSMYNCTLKIEYSYKNPSTGRSIDYNETYKYIISNPSLNQMWQYYSTTPIISRESIMNTIDYTNTFAIIDNEAYIMPLHKSAFYGGFLDKSIRREASTLGGIVYTEMSYYISTIDGRKVDVLNNNTFTINNGRNLVYAINYINANNDGSTNYTIKFNIKTLDLSGTLLLNSITGGKKALNLTIMGYEDKTKETKQKEDGTIISGLNIVSDSWGGLIGYIAPGSKVKVSKLRIQNSYVFGKTYSGVIVGYQGSDSILSISKVAIESTCVYSYTNKAGAFIGCRVDIINNDKSEIANSYAVINTEPIYIALIGTIIGSTNLDTLRKFATNNIKNVYLAGYEYYNKNIHTDSVSTGVVAGNYAGLLDLVASTNFDGSTSFIYVYATTTATGTTLEKYQGETGKNNFTKVGYRFVEGENENGHWLQNDDNAINYGFPLINYSSKYWCDDIEEVVPNTVEGVEEYHVKTPQQLAWIAYQTNECEETFKNKKVILDNNIDLKDGIWVPISSSGDIVGSPSKGFAGEFNGQGHTISNLYSEGYCSTGGINLDNRFGGLFGIICLGKVLNFKLDNFEVNANSAGMIDMALISTVQDVDITNATLSVINGDIGGVVLYPRDSYIFNCSIAESKFIVLNKISKDFGVGGIAGCITIGYVGGDNGTKIISCRVDKLQLDVTDDDYNTYVGLIVGQLDAGLLQNNIVIVAEISNIRYNDPNNYSLFGMIAGYSTGDNKIFETKIKLSDGIIDERIRWIRNVREVRVVKTIDSLYDLYGVKDGGDLENIYIDASVTSKQLASITSLVPRDTKGYCISYESDSGSTPKQTDEYWGNGTAKNNMNHTDYTEMYDYFGTRFQSSRTLLCGWTTPLPAGNYSLSGYDYALQVITDTDKDKKYKEGAISPRTTDIKIGSAMEHNYVADYVAFRYSNNRTFNIIYDLSTGHTNYSVGALGGNLNTIGNYLYVLGSDSSTISITMSPSDTNKYITVDNYIFYPGDKPFSSGFFGHVRNANISDFVIKINTKSIFGNPYPTVMLSTATQQGVLVDIAGACNINNCHVSVLDDSTITIEQAGGSKEKIIGGIVGYCANGTNITNCTSSVSFKFTDDNTYSRIGGVVGWVDNPKTMTSKLTDNKFTGSIDSNVRAGGIAGSAVNTQFGKCSNSGVIKGHNDVGGIVGYAESCDLGYDENSGNTNTGNITGDGNIGGIVGYASYTAGYCLGSLNENNKIYMRINYNTNSGEICGTENTGGIVGWIAYAVDETGTDISKWLLLVSRNTNSGIINSDSTKITENTQNTGGIVGYVTGKWWTGKTAGYYRISVNSNIVSANVNGYTNVGGITGYQDKCNDVQYTNNKVNGSADNRLSVSGYTSVSGLIGRYVFEKTMALTVKCPVYLNTNLLSNVDMMGYNYVYLLSNTTVEGADTGMAIFHVNSSNRNSSWGKGYIQNCHVISMVEKTDSALFNIYTTHIWGSWKNAMSDTIANLYGEYGKCDEEGKTFVANGIKIVLDPKGSSIVGGGITIKLRNVYAHNGMFYFDYTGGTLVIKPTKYNSEYKRVDMFKDDNDNSFKLQTVVYCKSCGREIVEFNFVSDVTTGKSYIQCDICGNEAEIRPKTP